MSEYEALSAKLDEIRAITVISVKSALTPEEAALYMGMSSEYVRRMAKQKQIKSYRSKSGRGIYFHKADLDHWMLHTEVNTREHINAEAARISRRLASGGN